MGSLGMGDNSSSCCSGEEEGSYASTIISVVNSKLLGRSGDITLGIDGFGIFTDPVTGHREVIRRFTWVNKVTNMMVQLISYGATITRIKVPDMNGDTEDVVLGFDTIDGYVAKDNQYFGATIGRVANRISKGEFYIDDEKINVSTNWNDEYTIHGGYYGFDKRNWVSYHDGLKVVMTHVSEDNSEGFPGIVMAVATFQVLPDNSIHILYNATASKKTPVSMTNHTYFNLAGHASGYPELYKHIVSLNADKMNETDENLIMTGRILCVGGTLYDLRIPKELGPVMTRVPCRGYDSNFCITQGTEQTLTFVARAIHPETGRSLEVYSNMPGVQFYTSNSLPDPLGIITPSQVNTQYFYNEEQSEMSSTSSEGTGNGSLKRSNAKSIDGDVTGGECGEGEETLSMTDSSQLDLPISGKAGAIYLKHAAITFETQKIPDAVNHDNFPSILLKPGETYHHEIIYKFGIHIAPEVSVCSERLAAKK